METKIKDIKKQILLMDKQLEYYKKNKKLVRIKRDPRIDPDNSYGIVLDYSDDFILIAYAYDFVMDGWRIIDRFFVKEIKATHSDNYCKKIMQKEGLLDDIDPPIDINISSYKTIFSSFKKHKQFVIVEDEHIEAGVFLIGPVREISKDSVSIRHFDGNGEWVTGRRGIKFKDISLIQFGNNYIRLHQKYINTKL